VTSRTLPLPVVPLSWRVPIGIALVVLTAAALVLNAVAATPAIGPYPQPIDSTVMGPPGIAILTGHWREVFADRAVQEGPIELIFWGIPYLLGLSTATGWIIFGIIVGIPFSIAVAAVSERVLRGISPTWSVTLAMGVAAACALTGRITAATSAGHPAEIAVPLLWIVAGLMARRGWSAAAAAVLASTAGWELWGLLGVPILLLAPRIGWTTIWRSAVAGAAVLLVLFAPFAVIGPFRMFSFAWPIRPDTLAHLLIPDARFFPWPLRLAQAALAVGAGTATTLLLRRRIDALWLTPLVVCAVRLLIDPVLVQYYSVTPVILVLLGTAVGLAQRRLLPFLLGLIMMNLLVDAPLGLIVAGILTLLVTVTAVIVIRGGRGENSGRQLVPERDVSRI
jgi:hypothetical protein